MIRIIQGDALTKLRELPSQSVRCCVTSPPYWGLRDYGTAMWKGGDQNCIHTGSILRTAPPGTAKQASKPGANFVRSGNCRCGAKRIDVQVGLEKTPEAYVAKLVEIFREVRRVLKNGGTLWLNLGDTYATTPVGSFNGGSKSMGWKKYGEGNKQSGIIDKIQASGLKPKDLIGIPWRVAFALQADGWYLRSDIIWAKPNPMPESVTDRPTKSHEYIFLFSKRERYYYDAKAIVESCSEKTVWTYAQPDKAARAGITNNGTGASGLREFSNGFRNKRSVWTVPAMPYAEAHFAVYSPKLIKPCILAGSFPGETILDPFAGSGTTGMVAIENNRKAILIELNPKYVKLIPKRCATHLVLRTIKAK